MTNTITATEPLLDSLAEIALTHPDPWFRERAYGKLMRRIRAIAERQMGARARAVMEPESICMSVVTDIYAGLARGELRFDTPAKLESFLWKKIRNKILSRLPRRTVYARIGNDVEAGEINPTADEADEPVRVLIDQETVLLQRQRLHRALESLSPKHRIVIDLYLCHAGTPIRSDDIAASSGMGAANCRKIFERFKSTVQDHLASDAAAAGDDSRPER